MDTLSLATLNRTLLHRQRLLTPSDETSLELIRHLGGLQAQEGPAPYFALHARLNSFQRGDLDAVRAKHAVVRATLQRRTIHLLAKEDYLGWQPHYQLRSEKDLLKRGFTRKDVEAWLPAVREALPPAGFGKHELSAALASVMKPGTYDQASHFVLLASLELLREPGSGGEFLGGKERWIKHELLTGKRAAAQPVTAMIERYLGACGPATPGDFSAWSGLPAAKTFFEAMPHLVQLKDEAGRTLYDVAGAPILSGHEEAPPVQLLSDFDNLILSHSDRSRIISDAHRSRMNKNLLAMCPMLVDGWFAGTWKARNKKGVAEASLTPYEKISKRQRGQLEEAAVDALAMWRPEFKPTITFTE